MADALAKINPHCPMFFFFPQAELGEKMGRGIRENTPGEVVRRKSFVKKRARNLKKSLIKTQTA
jgi:hypothetical protein